MLLLKKEGLYCPKGGFYIDPRRPVPQALITHAHGDHARPGSAHYFVHPSSIEILQYRLGEGINVSAMPYGEKKKMGSVWVSFHPAGHILGSSQIRMEEGSHVAVVSGDYKRAPDPTCIPFEPLACDLFVTESTFAMPIYRWESPQKVTNALYQWWQNNAGENHPSLLFCYTLGKAQRILAMLKEHTEHEVFIHGSIAPINTFYKNQGIPLLDTKIVTEQEFNRDYSKDLILAPVSAYRSLWMRRFKKPRTAFASGWMAVRGTRRRQGFDNGFVLSDHADWEELIQTVKETTAKKVWVTHGETELFSRYLQEVHGIQAESLPGFVQEDED